MTRALVLEDFVTASAVPAQPAPPSPEPPPAASAPAEAPEAAFERGYRAGWDDCEAEAQETRSTIGAELARNIQELGFTYHEARAHVLSGIGPILKALIEKLLPKCVTETLGAAILEELEQVAETAADVPVTILVAPGSHDRIAACLTDATALPFELVAEPALGEWQVFFRLGDHERQLDFGEIQQRILSRLAAFTDQNEKALKHG